MLYIYATIFLLLYTGTAGAAVADTTLANFSATSQKRVLFGSTSQAESFAGSSKRVRLDDCKLYDMINNPYHVKYL